MFLIQGYNYTNIEFRENPFVTSPVVPCGQTDGRTDMKQITVVLRNFANVSKEKLRKIFY